MNYYIACVKQFRLEFDHDLVLEPNTIANGYVVLKLLQPLFVSAIRVRFYGEEFLSPLKTVLFDKSIDIWGCSSLDAVMKMPVELASGEHEFPFTIRMPNINYPPTFEPNQGDMPELSNQYISYQCQAILDLPGYPRALSRTTKLRFCPVIIIDSSNESYIHTSFLKSNSPRYELNISLPLPKALFRAGDIFEAPLRLSIPKSSSNDLKKFQLSFQKLVRITLLRDTVISSANSLSAVSEKTFRYTIWRHNFECKLEKGNDMTLMLKFDIPPTLSTPTFQSIHHIFSYAFGFHFTLGNGICIDYNIPIPIGNFSSEEAVGLETVLHFTRAPSTSEPELLRVNDTCANLVLLTQGRTTNTAIVINTEIPPPSYEEVQVG